MGVGCGRSDANEEADADEEGEAREVANVGEDTELIGRGGDDTADAAVGCGGEESEGLGGGASMAPAEDQAGHPGRARGGPIAPGGRRQGKALRILRFHHVCQERGGLTRIRGWQAAGLRRRP